MNFPLNLKDNPKQALMLAAGVAVVAAFIYVKFLLLPQIDSATKSFRQAKTMQSDVKVAEKDIAKIGRLKKEIEAYRSKIESYERMLPIEQEVPKLLETLSTMARSSNVKIAGITPLASKQEASPEKIYQEIPIQVSAKSGYHELGKFLSDLESSGRFMKVADIDIKENKSNVKRHDVELLVLTYVLLENR